MSLIILRFRRVVGTRVMAHVLGALEDPERQAGQDDIPAFYADVIESEIRKCNHEKIFTYIFVVLLTYFCTH
mgnify:CR=1 FL=1